MCVCMRGCAFRQIDCSARNSHTHIWTAVRGAAAQHRHSAQSAWSVRTGGRWQLSHCLSSSRHQWYVCMCVGGGVVTCILIVVVHRHAARRRCSCWWRRTRRRSAFWRPRFVQCQSHQRSQSTPMCCSRRCCCCYFVCAVVLYVCMNVFVVGSPSIIGFGWCWSIISYSIGNCCWYCKFIQISQVLEFFFKKKKKVKGTVIRLFTLPKGQLVRFCIEQLISS